MHMPANPATGLVQGHLPSPLGEHIGNPQGNRAARAIPNVTQQEVGEAEVGPRGTGP